MKESKVEDTKVVKNTKEVKGELVDYKVTTYPLKGSTLTKWVRGPDHESVKAACALFWNDCTVVKLDIGRDIPDEAMDLVIRQSLLNESSRVASMAAYSIADAIERLAPHQDLVLKDNKSACDITIACDEFGLLWVTFSVTVKDGSQRVFDHGNHTKAGAEKVARGLLVEGSTWECVTYGTIDN